MTPTAGAPSITPATVMARARDVRYRVLEGEGVVVRQDAAEVLVVNEVGARILDLLDGTTPASGIHEQLAREYEVEPQELERDLLAYLGELVAAGLAVVVRS